MKIGPAGDIQFDNEAEIPRTGRSLGTMAWNRTGSWRNIEPLYRDLTSPCVNACPAGNEVSGWLGLAAQGRFAEAVELLRTTNPFPAVCGRVCPHPCERACLRDRHGGPISVARVERFLGDWAIEHDVPVDAEPPNGRRVAIVGAGPAGLSAAFQLGRRGFDVTVFDENPKPGGLLRYGIPEFRLPKRVLDAELRVFDSLPVRFECGTRVDLRDLPRFERVILAIGRYRGRDLGVPGEERAIQGIEFLRKGADVGPRVAVIGGGSTAFDCARTLKRLGKDPVILYRRSEKEMPAFAHDVEEAFEEGIELRTMTVPVEILPHAIRCARTAPGAKPIPGSEFLLRVDAVIKAVGEVVDGELPEGVPACGDCAGGAGTVSDAIGRGRAMAVEIAARPPVATAESLNPAWIPSRPRPTFPRVSATARVLGFTEVNPDVPADLVIGEAKRCLSCGTCSFCHTCMNLCPDGAIRFTGSEYEIDYAWCKGCLICVQECPRGAMTAREVTNEKSPQR